MDFRSKWSPPKWHLETGWIPFPHLISQRPHDNWNKTEVHHCKTNWGHLLSHTSAVCLHKVPWVEIRLSRSLSAQHAQNTAFYSAVCGHNQKMEQGEGASDMGNKTTLRHPASLPHRELRRNGTHAPKGRNSAPLVEHTTTDPVGASSPPFCQPAVGSWCFRHLRLLPRPAGMGVRGCAES